MAVDIFDFWSQVEPSARKHPADNQVLSRVKDHGFCFDALPGCFMGPLQTAPVVLLYLSPGLGDDDEPTEELIAWHARQRSGTAPLPTAQEHAGANRWWLSRTKCFDSGAAELLLREKVAVLNIAAYHSKEFKAWTYCPRYHQAASRWTGLRASYSPKP